MRWVSRLDQAAMAPMIVMPKQMAPMVSGTWLDPGGATIAKTAGRNATMERLMFWEMGHAGPGREHLLEERGVGGVPGLVEDANG
jgi:hypothetical protein